MLARTCLTLLMPINTIVKRNSISTPLPRDLVRSYLCQIIMGVMECHSHDIWHRDLRPSNILINGQGKIKIADFGLCKRVGNSLQTLTHEVVTLWYRCPEVLLGKIMYSKAIDVWSIGVIFSEMVTKRPLWPGDSEVDQLFKIYRSLGTPNESTWLGCTALPNYNTSFPQWKPALNEMFLMHNCTLDEDGFSLLLSFLTYDPAKRIHLEDALSHKWLCDYFLETEWSV